MNVFKKSLFPEKMFDNIEKKDGLIAIGYFLCFFVLEFLLLYSLKASPLYEYLNNDINYFYHLVFALIMDFPAFFLLFIILKIRKQGFSTVGLKRIGLKSSLFVGAVLLISFLFYYIFNNGFNFRLLYGTLFYIAGIGFFEELIFRGFLWSRLVIGFGRVPGTIISGLFFGLAHIPLDIVFKNKSIMEVVISGNVSTTNIFGGVVAALMFIYIYTRNENILLPAFVHGMLDLMSL